MSAPFGGLMHSPPRPSILPRIRYRRRWLIPQLKVQWLWDDSRGPVALFETKNSRRDLRGGAGWVEGWERSEPTRGRGQPRAP
jgi:hypothetical protein